MNISVEHFGDPVTPATERERNRQAARQRSYEVTQRTLRICTAPLALGGAVLVAMQVMATYPSALWLVVGLLLMVPLLATFTVKL